MKNTVYPIAHFQGNTNTLQHHLDTLLDVATAQDKNLQAINKAYGGLIKTLISAAQGKEGVEISKTQLDCIKVLLAEHKHLNKVVAEIEDLIKKVRFVEEATKAEETPQPEQPRKLNPALLKSTKFN